MPTCPNCQHSFDEEENYCIQFDNFLSLADAALAHVREHGVRVLSHDDPRTRLLGYETDTLGPNRRWWFINLSDMRNSMVDVAEDSRMGIYRSYLAWAAGRALIAAAWSEGREPTTHFKCKPTE